MHRRQGLAALLLASTWALLAPRLLRAAEAEASFGGVKLPEALVLEDVDPPLRRVAHELVERAYMPFYGVALYAPKHVRSRVELLDALEPCAIVQIWLAPKLAAEAIRAYYREELAQVTTAELLAAQSTRLERLLEALPASDRGHVWRWIYRPERGMQLEIDGQERALLTGIEANRLWLGLWLSDRADAGLRLAVDRRWNGS
jgi:hypothetical protein